MRCDRAIRAAIHVKDVSGIGRAIRELKRIEQQDGVFFEPVFIVKEAGKEDPGGTKPKDECGGYGADQYGHW